MAYRVIKLFTDGQDGLYEYKVGDKYPREGYTPTSKRIKGLLGTDNKQGRPLIEEVPDEVPEESPEITEEPEVIEEEPKEEVKKTKAKRKKK